LGGGKISRTLKFETEVDFSEYLFLEFGRARRFFSCEKELFQQRFVPEIAKRKKQKFALFLPTKVSALIV